MPRAYKSMLSFFQDAHDIPGYFEMDLVVPKDEDDMSRVVTWQNDAPAESPAAA